MSRRGRGARLQGFGPEQGSSCTSQRLLGALGLGQVSTVAHLRQTMQREVGPPVAAGVSLLVLGPLGFPGIALLAACWWERVALLGFPASGLGQWACPAG